VSADPRSAIAASSSAYARLRWAQNAGAKYGEAGSAVCEHCPTRACVQRHAARAAAGAAVRATQAAALQEGAPNSATASPACSRGSTARNSAATGPSSRAGGDPKTRCSLASCAPRTTRMRVNGCPTRGRCACCAQRGLCCVADAEARLAWRALNIKHDPVQLSCPALEQHEKPAPRCAGACRDARRALHAALAAPSHMRTQPHVRQGTARGDAWYPLICAPAQYVTSTCSASSAASSGCSAPRVRCQPA